MEAAPDRVIRYFDGTKQNLIPLFQRPYSWTEADWKTLWEDILLCQETSGAHFMGAVVTAPANSVPVGVGKSLVIDGQQRLTTISILLAALRDALGGTLGGHRKAALIQDYLVNRHYEGTADDLKLLPTQVDRDAYRSLVLDGTYDHSSNVLDAYRYFKYRIGHDDVDAETILDTLQSKLQVVYIHLGESDDPYLIFESLNAKGKDLDPTDLVRNYVLMRFRHAAGAGGEQEEVYLSVWRPLETQLKGSLDAFLFHYAQKDGDETVRKSFYPSFKERIRRSEADGELREELEELREAGLQYRILLGQSEAVPSPVIVEHIRALQALNTQTAFPLLLRLLRLYRMDQMEIGTLERSFGDVVGYLIRRAVCGVPTNVLNKRFARLCRGLSDYDAASWLHNEFAKSDHREKCPSNAEIIDAIRTQNQYGRSFLPYLLRRIEMSYGHLESITFERLTVEHILPQTLTSDWREELGIDAETIHSVAVHRLGNLTLTGYNGTLSNDPFALKREHLKDSNLSMNKEIAEKSTWREQEIEERGLRMAAIIAEIWPMPV